MPVYKLCGNYLIYFSCITKVLISFALSVMFVVTESFITTITIVSKKKKKKKEMEKGKGMQE